MAKQKGSAPRESDNFFVFGLPCCLIPLNSTLL